MSDSFKGWICRPISEARVDRSSSSVPLESNGAWMRLEANITSLKVEVYELKYVQFYNFYSV